MPRFSQGECEALILLFLWVSALINLFEWVGSRFCVNECLYLCLFLRSPLGVVVAMFL